MKNLHFILALALAGLLSGCGHSQYNKYYPVEDKKVQQKIEDWRQLKFGLFMHWGTYTQWGIVESWAMCAEDEAWCRRENPDYEDFKRNYVNLKTTFNPVDFEPEKWADAAEKAGMKYLVFTVKHHDGFNMFDTQLSDYKITSTECPFHTHPRVDVTRAIFEEFQKKDFMIGAYLSKPDWNNENFWWPNFATPDRNVNYSIEKHPERWEAFVDFFHGQVDELMSNYGQVDILWMDGGWVRALSKWQKWQIEKINGLFLKSGYTQLNIPQDQDLRISEMAAKAREKQPGLIVVDRDVEGPNENYLTPEQFIPQEFNEAPWESCITLAGSWAYNPNDAFKSTRTVIHMLCDIVSKNGSLLLNVGPSPEGVWPETVYNRFSEIGQWMDVNGAAIYHTWGRKNFGQEKERYTVNPDGSINAFYLMDKDEEVPSEIVFSDFHIKKDQTVRLLGWDQEISWTGVGKKLTIHLPGEIRKSFKNTPALTFTTQ